MDLMYLPDAFTFHVIRSPPIYNARGYDYLDAMLEEEEEARRRKMRKAKEKNGKPTQCAGAGPKENHLPEQGKSSSKDSCPMCKEKRRRTLASYIRSKSRQDNTGNSVIEEEEETVQEEEETVQEEKQGDK